jgi:pyruvate/2-oxoglutarate dehydrogenase complex dihydrolipoamide dehydrogenase (E3) component
MYLQLRAALADAATPGPKKVLVVGAGLVGSELANDLALGGHRVTLLDTQAEPLSRWTVQQAVDAGTLRTSVPQIYALGDCITVNGQASRFIEPIARQVRTVAAAITGQAPVPYETRAALLRVKTSSLPLTLH